MEIETKTQEVCVYNKIIYNKSQVYKKNINSD